ncbi:hypothetical protein COO09_09765 [Rhizorhabdus dicambivorans]|uniref:Uncharacterized protein n=1 Tax=Rhizorhabdus dicambivorans TaxID=1850238 RepID=A0A2A4FUM9_9SPHN|nr:hypothetical protein CMV14_14015 [Rhizorhabdus dicambivorans]PCE42472.1 hypothetical protein COO09_09765 [Rhizorhabdus dicambivorans]
MMSLLGLLTATTVAAGDIGHHHRTTLDHRGAALNVDYRATVSLSTRQMGMAPPTRMGVIRCDWVARVAVHRTLERGDAGEALSRLVDDDLELRGNRSGTCSSARKAIDGELAKRQDEVRVHLASVVERDRAQLLAELETAAGGTHSAH